MSNYLLVSMTSVTGKICEPFIAKLHNPLPTYASKCLTRNSNKLSVAADQAWLRDSICREFREMEINLIGRCQLAMEFHTDQ